MANIYLNSRVVLKEGPMFHKDEAKWVGLTGVIDCIRHGMAHEKETYGITTDDGQQGWWEGSEGFTVL